MCKRCYYGVLPHQIGLHHHSVHGKNMKAAKDIEEYVNQLGDRVERNPTNLSTPVDALYAFEGIDIQNDGLRFIYNKDTDLLASGQRCDRIFRDFDSLQKHRSEYHAQNLQWQGELPKLYRTGVRYQELLTDGSWSFLVEAKVEDENSTVHKFDISDNSQSDSISGSDTNHQLARKRSVSTTMREMSLDIQAQSLGRAEDIGLLRMSDTNKQKWQDVAREMIEDAIVFEDQKTTYDESMIDLASRTVQDLVGRCAWCVCMYEWIGLDDKTDKEEDFMANRVVEHTNHHMKNCEMKKCPRGCWEMVKQGATHLELAAGECPVCYLGNIYCRCKPYRKGKPKLLLLSIIAVGIQIAEEWLESVESEINSEEESDTARIEELMDLLGQRIIVNGTSELRVAIEAGKIIQSIKGDDDS